MTGGTRAPCPVPDSPNSRCTAGRLRAGSSSAWCRCRARSSSGLTTTVCGARKEGLKEVQRDLGLFVAGGKGATSRRTSGEIGAACERTGLDPAALVHASRIAAKVDNSAVQDGYQLYHHAFIFTAKGDWCIVQQGMNDATAMARRYHWLSESVRSYVDEPHAAVCCDARQETLNVVAHESAAVRDASATLAALRPEVTLEALGHLPNLEMPRRHPVVEAADIDPARLRRILLRTYEAAPADFESLLAIEGMGARRSDPHSPIQLPEFPKWGSDPN
ncbi:MAG TPA: DUF763 domain-containing protein [Usitatibacter sp.]|nr:DUF763 domain-containing protein [Usitatibacter sp.]